MRLSNTEAIEILENILIGWKEIAMEFNTVDERFLNNIEALQIAIEVMKYTLD